MALSHDRHDSIAGACHAGSEVTFEIYNVKTPTAYVSRAGTT